MGYKLKINIDAAPNETGSGFGDVLWLRRWVEVLQYHSVEYLVREINRYTPKVCYHRLLSCQENLICYSLITILEDFRLIPVRGFIFFQSAALTLGFQY